MISQRHTDEKHAQRTSFYLVRKAESLLGALEFFAAAGSDGRRRLQFLAQSDFWEWELDNLIYSFATLAERQKTWQSETFTGAKLLSLGIVVEAKILKRLRWQSGSWQAKSAGARLAPVAMLQQVVDRWNHLISVTEQQFVEPMQSNAQKLGVNTRADLSTLHRQMPGGLDGLDSENETAAITEDPVA